MELPHELAGRRRDAAQLAGLAAALLQRQLGLVRRLAQDQDPPQGPHAAGLQRLPQTAQERLPRRVPEIRNRQREQRRRNEEEEVRLHPHPGHIQELQGRSQDEEPEDNARRPLQGRRDQELRVPRRDRARDGRALLQVRGVPGGRRRVRGRRRRGPVAGVQRRRRRRARAAAGDHGADPAERAPEPTALQDERGRLHAHVAHRPAAAHRAPLHHHVAADESRLKRNLSSLISILPHGRSGRCGCVIVV